MRELKQNTAANVMVFMTLASDHISGATGKTLTITASKDGGAFASITPTVSERGDGWYNLALTGTHTNTLGDLCLHITAADCDPTDVRMLVILLDKFIAKQPVTLAAGDVSGNLPASVLAIADGLLTAAKFGAAALNGLGDWNIGKTGYSLHADYDPAKTAAQAGDQMDLVNTPNATARQSFATTLEAAILNEGDATALLAAIAAKVEEFLANEGDATATIAAIATAVWANSTRTLTSGANIVLAKNTGLTGLNDPSPTAIWTHGTRELTSNANFNDLSEAELRDSIGLATANLDTQLGDILAASGGGGGGIDMADAVPDPGTDGTVGRALRLILTYVDAAITSRLAGGSYTPPDNAGISSAAASASTAASAAGTAAGVLSAITEDVGGVRLTEHAFDAMPTATVELDQQAINDIAQGVVTEIGDALAQELADTLGDEIAEKVVGEALEGYNIAGTVGKAISDIWTKVNTLSGGGSGGNSGSLDFSLQFNLGQSGQALYFVLWDDAGRAWDVDAEEFVTYTDDREAFAISMSEVGTSGYYSATFPASGDGFRRWEIFRRVGATPSHADDLSLDADDNAGGASEQIVHVPIMPLNVARSTGEVISSPITLYRNATIGPLVFPVRDTQRQPVNLTGKTLRFHIWKDDNAAPLVDVGPFAATGDDNNIVTVTGPAIELEPGEYSYTLWNMTDGTVCGTAECIIKPQSAVS